MRLSKIKLAGFKTFVDPTVLSFPSNLTGIIGPNGCGKSNIIDAIRALKTDAVTNVEDATTLISGITPPIWANAIVVIATIIFQSTRSYSSYALKKNGDDEVRLKIIIAWAAKISCS